MRFQQAIIACLLLVSVGWSTERCKFAARAKAAVQGKTSFAGKLLAVRAHVQKTVAETDASYG